jgi:hypothetical protein
MSNPPGPEASLENSSHNSGLFVFVTESECRSEKKLFLNKRAEIEYYIHWNSSF